MATYTSGGIYINYTKLSFFIGAQIGAYDVVLVNMVPAPAMNLPALLKEAMKQAKVNISRTVVHEKLT